MDKFTHQDPKPLNVFSGVDNFLVSSMKLGLLSLLDI
jgi:hypothetical protein